MDPHPLKACRLVSAGLFLTVRGRDLYAEGSFEAEGEALCDRCTEPVKVKLEKNFQTILAPRDLGRSDAANVELHTDDLDIGFYDGSGVEVADVFWEQVALAIPLKVLCSEECKGVCPSCGCNRNREECGCPEPTRTGAFDILKTIRKEKE